MVSTLLRTKHRNKKSGPNIGTKKIPDQTLEQSNFRTKHWKKSGPNIGTKKSCPGSMAYVLYHLRPRRLEIMGREIESS
jgi:hypothetical protein